MRKSRYTEKQIEDAPKASEAGRPTAEVRWMHRISEHAFNRGKTKCGNLEMGDTNSARRLPI